ncbi:ASKHA domain-containing protein [Mangrovibacterium sp.]|uniref:ASKHA domain-containing protein n=1 Tax=Mangrovibacterium sp. TaxID=1961364 RepID=UPI0035661885
MKHRVILKNSTATKSVEVDDGANLLQCIREQVDNFYAPCGGNGTCGKCRVHIPGEGHVTSCLYYVSKDLEVILPNRVEMQVLSTQYKLTKILPSNPGKALMDLATIPYGLAIDIGTTTIVYYVVNLLFGSVVDIISMTNPQSKFGADVISRINYGATTPKGLAELQQVLVFSLNDAIDQFCSNNQISPTEFVKIAVVGNTIMLHNLLGVDALPIAHAPFTPQFTDAKTMPASELGIHIHPKGELILAPSLSAYVGADILAGLASIDCSKLGKNFLFIDIGTNGEIVLATPEKKLACATAAGPAFEGANISCGMAALPGAISEYSEHGFKVISGTSPTGICGSGLVDIIATMLETGALEPDGNIAEDFIICTNDFSTTIVLSQQDVREIQLAKSAVLSGINRLMAIAGLSMDELDHVLLAGGFGNYLNIANAIRMGLLPQVPLEKYIQVGNSAGSGAVLALKSEVFMTELETLKEEINYIELSTDDEFTMEFAMNMYF